MKMKVYNTLPLFKILLKKWKNIPSEQEFIDLYANPMEKYVGNFFTDFYSEVLKVNWKNYRKKTLECDDVKWEENLKKHIRDVEKLFGNKLNGESVLFASFHTLDGFARFDHGTHKVFLGIDESHDDGNYLDILMVHELVHVIRESRESVWTGWGLNPKMIRADFLESQPTIEHLFSEGFSCVISELLVPGEHRWRYCYQTAETFKHILSNGKSVSQRIHAEITKPNHGNFGNLYNTRSYEPRMPEFTHYAWAYLWVKKLMSDLARNNPKQIVELCSKDFIEHALAFEIGS